MKTSATIRTELRRWSCRSRGFETCNLHGEPRVQVACQLPISSCGHSESLAYFKAVTTTQTSTHSDDRMRSTCTETLTVRKINKFGHAPKWSRLIHSGRTPGHQPRSSTEPLPRSEQASCRISVTRTAEQPIRALRPFPPSALTIHKRRTLKIGAPHSGIGKFG
jgi:hypothetical protein